MAQAKDPNSWYNYHGVKPPDSISHATPEEIEGLFNDVIKDTKHGSWRQIGDTIHCGRCGNHGHRISTSKMLVGETDDGLPKLKDIV